MATKQSATAPAKTAAAWLQNFARALAAGDAAAVGALFHAESYWRDLVAFTWNIKTAEGRAAVEAMAAATGPAAGAAEFDIDDSAGGASESDGVVEAWFTFTTGVGRGRGLVRLRDGKCWTLLTTLAELKGFEERDDHHGTRERGVAHGAQRGRQTWLEKKRAEEAELGITRQPYCVIIGGGQGGIGLAARLKRLGVPTIIVEKNPRAGDSWRNRYRSLCLHDPVWYDHMPYLPFPAHWPVFSPKDKIGDWLEAYTSVMELNYWAATRCLSARYDAAAGEWEVTVMRGGDGDGDGDGDGGDGGDGETVILRPKQLVLATGMSGVPNMPELPGADEFTGEICHSSKHKARAAGAASAAWSSARTTPRTTSAPSCGRPARMSPWCSAHRRMWRAPSR